MSQASTPIETTRGYAPPSVRQFSVFLANQIGKLYELLEIFESEPGVQLCALSVVDSADHAVVRMIPNNSAAARALLRDHNLPFSEMDILVVELTGSHTLTSLCLYLLGAELNIQFAYPLMLTPTGESAIALAVDDRIIEDISVTQVRFRQLSNDEIQRYCDTGEPYDKAGGYGIQGVAGVFVEHLEGSYTGVMGLPVFETARLLRHAGIVLP